MGIPIQFILLYALLISVISNPSPNIIVIVADDLGWNDVSFHGSPQIPTPNIDSFARQGVILNNYYVCPLCSPSRGALMTGLYPIHTGLQYDVIYVPQPWGLPLEFRLLPQYLQELGYATHAIGKWHLGFFKKEYTPTYRGFDSHFGYWSGSGDYYDHTQQTDEYWGLDFRYNETSVREGFQKYSTFLFSDHAENIINNHNTTKPLFLYLAYQAVHSGNSYAPLQAPAEYVSRFNHIKDENRRIYAGMVSALDDGVGKVLKTLEDKGMLKNSIVVFTSDNGGPAAGFNMNAASNWPLRGVKATLWEGGVRGTAFIWSPLLKKSPRVSMNMMHIADWFPTLIRAAGGKVSSLGTIDGYDMWDTLSFSKPSPRIEILLNIDPIIGSSAIRVGDHKLIYGRQFDGQWDSWYGPSGQEHSSTSKYDVRCGPKPENASKNCIPEDSPCVFDVVNDPCEYNNLAVSHPEVLAELKERLEFYNSTAIPPGIKPNDPMSNPKYHHYKWVSWKDSM